MTQANKTSQRGNRDDGRMFLQQMIIVVHPVNIGQGKNELTSSPLGVHRRPVRRCR